MPNVTNDSGCIMKRFKAREITTNPDAIIISTTAIMSVMSVPVTFVNLVPIMKFG